MIILQNLVNDDSHPRHSSTTTRLCGSSKLELVSTALIVALLVVFQFVYLLPQAVQEVVVAVGTSDRHHHHHAATERHARFSVVSVSLSLRQQLQEEKRLGVQDGKGESIPPPTTISENTKILAVANGETSYKNMAILWYHRMTELGYTTHELLALDDVAAQAFAEHGLRYTRLPLCKPPIDSKKGYRLHLFAMRWHHIQGLLQQGTNVLLTDVDNYFMSYKPMSDMEQLPDIDVVHAYSGNYPQNMIKVKGWGVCGGMIWVRASPGGRRMVETMLYNCGSYHNDTCALQCDDQRAINNIYMKNAMNFTLTMDEGQKNTNDMNPVEMAQWLWKPPLTGRSAVYNFTTWDVHTAYRGPAPPPNGTCPVGNWVAMPYAGRDRVEAMHKFRQQCDPAWEGAKHALKSLELNRNDNKKQ